MQKKYQALARRYRPQKFSEVVGQESVVTTLKNAIRLNRSTHAYLFSGSRGIGKTTLARLYAKALNCSNLTDDIEPCNRCQSCLEIASGNSLDVIEIDGASNRGIDDIRQINETIGYAPSAGKYKIYIIDEVHMLTKEAFNALLKTLEEPPAPIKFFFATTEPHKMPATIISRTQRFDLLRINHMQVVDKLLSIATELDRQIEPDAVHTIAHFSDGSLRDAESLFDQLLCFEEGLITSEVVNKTLGVIPSHYFFELDKAIIAEDISFVFSFVEKIYHAGKDLAYFVEELVTHFRHLLLAKIGHVLPQLSETLKEKYLVSAKDFTKDQLLYLLDYLLHSQQHLHKSPFKRVTVEMLLLQIIRSKNRISAPSLIHRLVQLEGKLNSGPTKEPLSKEAITTSTTDQQPAQPVPPKPTPTFSQQTQTQAPVRPLQETPKPAAPPINTPAPIPQNPTQVQRPAPAPVQQQKQQAPTPAPTPTFSQQPQTQAPIRPLQETPKPAAPPINTPAPIPQNPTQVHCPAPAPVQQQQQQAPRPTPTPTFSQQPQTQTPIRPLQETPLPPAPPINTPAPIPQNPTQVQRPAPAPIQQQHQAPRPTPAPVQQSIPTMAQQQTPSSATAVQSPPSQERPPSMMQTQHSFQKTNDDLKAIHPEPTPIEINKPLSAHKLEPVPFHQKKEETLEQKKKIPADKKHPSHYDTMMRFASVELDGTVKIDP